MKFPFGGGSAHGSNGLIYLWSGSAFCFDQDIDGIGAAIPEIEADAAIGNLPNGRGDGDGGEIPACGEHNSVARPAEAAVEDQFVAIEMIADWRGVRFGNAQADGLAFFHGRERNQDDLGGRTDGLTRVDFCGGEIGAGNQLCWKFIAGVQDVGGRVGNSAAFADYVKVFIGAFVEFGVVVVEAESVSFRLLQEVDNVAILMGALGEARMLGFSFEGRLPTTGSRWGAWHGSGSCLRAEPGAENQGRFPGAGVQKADGDAAVRLRQNLRGNITADQFVAHRQNDFVSPDPKRTIENDSIAIAVIALCVLVGFEDQDASLSFWRNGSSERNLDEVGIGIGVRHKRIFAGVGAADYLELERLAGHGVINGLGAGGATFANGVVEKRGACRGGGDFVMDCETGGFRGEKLVPRVFIGFGLLGRSGRSRRSFRLPCAE